MSELLIEGGRKKLVWLNILTYIDFIFFKKSKKNIHNFSIYLKNSRPPQSGTGIRAPFYLISSWEGFSIMWIRSRNCRAAVYFRTFPFAVWKLFKGI